MTERLDLMGLKCPLPVLRTRRALAGLPDGAVLDVLASDPLAAIDLPHLVAELGHALEAQTVVPGGVCFRILVRRSAEQAAG